MSRWIRLDIGWDESEWVFVLSEGSQLSWIKLLCHVKKSGFDGHAKRLSYSVATKVWGVGSESVEKMEQAALQDGALTIEDGQWQVANWSEFQGGVAERVRRFRERQKDKVEPVTPSNTCNVTVTKTETGTIEKEPKGSKRKNRPSSVGEVSAYMVEIGVADPRCEAEKFFDFYESKGWKVGKNPMNVWKAAARNWKKGAKVKPQASEDAPELTVVGYDGETPIFGVPKPETEEMK